MNIANLGASLLLIQVCGCWMQSGMFAGGCWGQCWLVGAGTGTRLLRLVGAAPWRQVLAAHLLACLPACLQIPIGEEERFEGMIDLVKMKALVWNGEVGAAVAGC